MVSSAFIKQSVSGLQSRRRRWKEREFFMGRQKALYKLSACLAGLGRGELKLALLNA